MASNGQVEVTALSEGEEAPQPNAEAAAPQLPANDDGLSDDPTWRAWIKLWLPRVKKVFSASRIATGLALLLAAFTIYQLFAAVRPTLRDTDSQTRAAQVQADATMWDKYQNWVLTICPAELAKNITSPDCEEAMKRPIPPPRKPEYPQASSLSNIAARWLVPSVNAFDALLSDLKASRNRCVEDSQPADSTSQLNCPSLQLDDVSQKHMISGQLWDTIREFPMPPHQDIDLPNSVPLTAWMFVGSSVEFCCVLGLAIYRWRCTQSTSTTTFTRCLENIVVSCAAFLFGAVNTLGLRLTHAMAKDTFLNNCMTYKVVEA